MEDVNPSNIPASTKVFVNGNWIGIVPDPETVVQAIQEQRRLGELEFEVSVYRNIAEQEIHVFTDAGRVCRPLFIVDTEYDAQINGRFQRLRITNDDVERIKQLEADAENAELAEGGVPEDHPARNRFSDLLNNGVIEYVDTLEEGGCLFLYFVCVASDLHAYKLDLDYLQSAQ